MKSYVTQQPNSNTNRTGFHRVVEYGEWMDYVNGKTSFLNAVNCTSQKEADDECARLNEKAEAEAEVKIIKITPEEAEAFRTRVRKQNEEMATWVVIPVDDLLELVEESLREGPS